LITDIGLIFSPSVLEELYYLLLFDETPLEPLKRAAGSWCDDPEGLDRFLEWNRQQRKINRRALPG